MRINRRAWMTIVLASAAIAAQLTLLWLRGTAFVVSGDEGTFLAMTSSLALDRDLEFGEADRKRLEGSVEGGRRAVILQRFGSRVAYSKPVLFPLLASPWYRLLGEAGVVIFNGVCLLLALVVARAFLLRRWTDGSVGVAVVTFAGTGVLLSYVAWTMSDSLQASLTLGGAALALGLGDNREPTGPMDRLFASRWSAAAGGVLLGLSVSMRYPNLLLAIALPIALALTGRRSRALAAAVSIVATLAGGLALNQLLTGAAVPYKAVRATFNEETGYPAGEGAEERLSHFQTAQATHRLGVVPQVQPAVTFYSTLYFFVGRHTGILLYGPAALVFAWLVVFGHRHAQRDLVGLTLVAAVVALAAFYLLWMPRNYFGGATFLGNRYFLTGYVLLLLAPQRAPGRRALASVWVIAGLTFFSAATSSARTWDTDGTSQMHASVGIFRLFPYESTAMDLDGRRDRYWSDELVRFVDPFAKVGAQGFKLSAGSPAAELVTACSREHGVIRLLVQSDVPEVEVVYRDWLQKKRFRLKSASGGARGFLEIVPSPTVRRHSYWWDSDASLAVRSFRLSLRTPDGGPADAEVRYAGPYRFVPRFYRAETESARIPGHGRAASLRRLALRVRNVGSRYWETDDPIPILVGYRLFRLPRTESEPVAIGPFSPLPRRIAPGEVLEMELEAAWPEEEGRYELVVDLVVAGLNWFEEWNGAPVAHRPIRVVTAADEGT